MIVMVQGLFSLSRREEEKKRSERMNEWRQRKSLRLLIVIQQEKQVNNVKIKRKGEREEREKVDDGVSKEKEEGDSLESVEKSDECLSL